MIELFDGYGQRPTVFIINKSIFTFQAVSFITKKQSGLHANRYKSMHYIGSNRKSPNSSLMRQPLGYRAL